MSALVSILWRWKRASDAAAAVETEAAACARVGSERRSSKAAQ